MGSKERKEREFEQRQERILEAAEKLFFRKGVNGVRLEDIAEAIEFSKGIIYLHFKSKEELFAHLLLRKATRLHEMLREAVSHDEPMRAGIDRCLETTVDFYLQNQEYYTLLFHVDVHAPNLSAELSRDILAMKRNCLTVFTEVLQRGKHQGALPDNVAPEQLALVLFGMLNGLLQLVETHQATKKNLGALVAMAMNLVFDGILKTK